MQSEEILKKFCEDIDKMDLPEVVKEDLKKQLKNNIKYESCPKFDNQPVSPMNCFMCPFGHLLHCHFPYTCSDPSSECVK
jgi:hypothetical protein